MNTVDKQDELIFDFLEGNLSPDEKEVFLILKEESEVLNREVRLWQNTYLKEPLPVVEALEKKLFIHHSQDGRNFSTRIYTLLMIALMLVLTPGSYKLNNHIDFHARINDVPFTPEATIDVQTAALNCLEEKLSFKAKYPIKMHKKIPAVEDHAQVNESLVMTDLKTEVRLFMPEQFAFPKITIRKTENKKSIAVAREKKWSRRERQEIRKKLWRDYRIRLEKEFLSGNEPYVVPLNNNNF